LLKELSDYLNDRFGKGFSVTTLKNARKFYQVYAPSIEHDSPVGLLDGAKGQAMLAEFDDAAQLKSRCSTAEIASNAC
jgi:hypothetical protein